VKHCFHPTSTIVAAGAFVAAAVFRHSLSQARVLRTALQYGAVLLETPAAGGSGGNARFRLAFAVLPDG
jgi:hypothetical protein